MNTWCAQEACKCQSRAEAHLSCSQPETRIYFCLGWVLGLRQNGLERVGQVNHLDEPRGRSLVQLVRGLLGWLRAWQHSTMPRRVNFLLSLIDDPSRERRFQRSVTLLRWTLLGGLVVALYALGEAVGWHELMQVM